VKLSASKRFAIKKKDEYWVEQERYRSREKYHRLYSSIKVPTENRRTALSNYKAKYPEKISARAACSGMPSISGYCYHHWSYDKCNWTDVFCIDNNFHYKIHRFMYYDQQSKSYRIKGSGDLLDSREKHEEFIKSIYPDYKQYLIHETYG